MKRLALFLLFAGTLHAQAPLMTLPARVPTHCVVPGKFLGNVPNSCKFITVPGMTVFVVTRTATGTITDSEGNTWTQDFCVAYNGNCIYHTFPNVQAFPELDTLTFPPNEGLEAVVLQYQNIGSTRWTFDQAKQGNYQGNNSTFADCTNGQDCPYWWTAPVEVQQGELLIEWGDSVASGPGIIVPGFGYNLEYSDGIFAVADMLAPVPGVYIGSMQSFNSDGSQSGGSHWLLGVAAYQQQ
jgi:hypothetical protein